MNACLILPYSGPLPPWTPLFLRSIERNPSIDLFLVYKDEVGYSLPGNVFQVRLSLREIEERVRGNLSDQLRLPHAYKLCDLKPFYALLFPELVDGHDFWGYCDLDLVLGDISALVCEQRLKDVDVFFADEKMVMGHFALFRNDPKINQIARRIPGYMERLLATKAMFVDEAGMEEVVASSPDVRWSMAHSLSESQLTVNANGKMMGQTNGVRGTRHSFFWRDGHAYIEEKASGRPQEVLYLHFMGLKRQIHWGKYDPSKACPEFSFSAAGFLPWVDPPTLWHRWSAVVRSFVFLSISTARGAIARAMPAEARLMLKELLRRRQRGR